ncbi:retrotransposon protein, putative, ty1-copia subclass [Tanacetum coccineum]|uniref:Retrotransposon protein, putative, ty1-copia subclass n=1 Tax=Tanacetum coccineum TaxID=301880 RepID=A0ABQ5FWX0_9ASTR
MFEKPPAVEIYDLVDFSTLLQKDLVRDLRIAHEYEKGLKDRCRINVCIIRAEGFNAERKLAYGDQYLHMGNGAQAVVEAIGTAISVNGVFEIDMNKNVTKNNNSVFSINKKRKLDLDSSYLWHCRLAHIGKTRMQKLQREGLLESINEESFDICEIVYGRSMFNPYYSTVILVGLCLESAVALLLLWFPLRDEDIYMEQPEGYVDPKFPNGVCKLQRAIYGLKQASRQWNKRFDEEIKRFGFIQNRDEPCVYRKASGSDVVFLILYVDDILIMGNNIPKLKEVKDYLGKCFSVKDLGEAAYFWELRYIEIDLCGLIGLTKVLTSIRY